MLNKINHLNNLMFGFVFLALLTSAVPVRMQETVPAHATPTTVDALLQMNGREFSELLGHKLSLKEKVIFRMAQRGMRKDVAQKHLQADVHVDVLQMMADGEKGFYVGGFLLGLLLGLIGVLIAYLTKKDKAFVKSAWIGWAIWVGIVVVLLAANGGAA